jgi:hypothetical protein
MIRLTMLRRFLFDAGLSHALNPRRVKIWSLDMKSTLINMIASIVRHLVGSDDTYTILLDMTL